jgi:hypothetical protein
MAVKRTILMLGLAALAACGAQPEPEESPRAQGAPEVPVMDVGQANTPPIRGLIGERQRLGLTGAQVTTLDSIAIVLAAANDSLRNSVREVTSTGPGRNAAIWERAGPALTQIGQNNRAAGLLVQNTLNEEQRQIACEMQAEQYAREPQRLRRPPPGAAGFPGGRSRVDTLALRRAQEGWPWCPPPPLPR